MVDALHALVITRRWISETLWHVGEMVQWSKLLTLIPVDEVQFPAKAAVFSVSLNKGLSDTRCLVGFPWLAVYYWIATLNNTYTHAHARTRISELGFWETYIRREVPLLKHVSRSLPKSSCRMSRRIQTSHMLSKQGSCSMFFWDFLAVSMHFMVHL